ncbi:MAG: hypothetical protein Q4B65_01005 [Candidatus Saccharibacteria bacterium]|nr:hypothetical protein [Candidatus Saccharibacteria bacterium]
MVKKSLLGVVALGATLLGGAVAVNPTYAAEEVTVCTSNCDYASIADAVSAVNTGAIAGKTIKLEENLSIPAQIIVKKDVVIDFNGKTVTSTAGAFDIQGGVTEFTGKGTLKSDSNGTLVWIMRNGVEAGKSVTFTLGKDITLDSAEGWGIAVWKNSVKASTVLNIDGVIKAPEAGAITINGNNSEANIVNINATADLSGDIGIYGAGNATWNIVEGAKVTGVESALGIKAGTWNISGGEFKATGAFVDAVTGNNNGINASGSAIQIEENEAYAGKVALNILGGKFTSENGRAIYEYLADADDKTILKDLNISGGTFESPKGVKVSDQLLAKADELTGITGGTFEGGVIDELIADGYELGSNGEIAKPVEEAKPGLGAPNTGAFTAEATSAKQDAAMIVLFASTMTAVVLLGYALKSER